MNKVGEKVKLRREKLEKVIKKKLMNISCFSLDAEKIEGRNLENMIGVVQVPLGIAGPLKIRSSRLNRDKTQNCFIPLATTEGALVASVNRGCKVIRKSGGCEILIEEKGTTRGPVFKVKNLKEGKKIVEWLKENRKKLEKAVKETDKHTKLTEVETKMVGRNVYVRFGFNTSEAMGMNMVTMATEKIAFIVKKELGIREVILSGNYCIDKKPSWLNFIKGRGKQVWAEVVITRKIVKSVLKTTPEKIADVVYRKQLLGSIMSGAMGFNAHYANMIAAIFLATGQDMAHVVEGSLGVTTAEIVNKGDLYFSIYLPDLMIGTVGGGTHLATQKECLSILGLDKVRKGDGLRFGEIIGGAVLAGELSLTAALASGDLAKAHQKLGRGK